MALRRFLKSCLQPKRLVILASFFIFFLSLGNISSFVILYVYLKEDFKTSATETGWVGSAAWTVVNFLVPLTSALYVRYGCQWVTLAGVLLAFAGLLATSFASRIWMMYITYGLIFGAGSNFILTSSINLVTSYYPGENNIRATSLVSVGQPLGLLVISASLDPACSHLGWRNGLRILAVFTLVLGLVCTALSRPLPKGTTDYLALNREARAVTSEAVTIGEQTEFTEDTSQRVQNETTETSKNETYQPIPRQETDDVMDDIDRADMNSNFDGFGAKTQNAVDFESFDDVGAHSTQTDCQLESRKDGVKSSASPAGKACHDAKESNAECFNHVTSETSLRKPCHLKQTNLTFWAKYVLLLRLPEHWLYFGGMVGSSLSTLFNVIHFVGFAGTINIPEPEASWLLLGMSGMEIAARVLIFACGNRLPVRPTVVYTAICLLGALATYGLLLFPTFVVVTFYMIILGFVRGIFYGIAFGAVVDMFGAERALECYTSLLLSYGIAGALASTIGMTKDLTGSFTASLHILAVLFVLSAILFVSAHVWLTRNPRIGRRDFTECDVGVREKAKDEKGATSDENGAVSGDAVTTRAPFGLRKV